MTAAGLWAELGSSSCLRCLHKALPLTVSFYLSRVQSCQRCQVILHAALNLLLYIPLLQSIHCKLHAGGTQRLTRRCPSLCAELHLDCADQQPVVAATNTPEHPIVPDAAAEPAAAQDVVDHPKVGSNTYEGAVLEIRMVYV